MSFKIYHLTDIPLTFRPVPIWRGHNYWNRKRWDWLSDEAAGPYMKIQKSLHFGGRSSHESRSQWCEDSIPVTFYCYWVTHVSDLSNCFEVCQKPGTSEKEFQMVGLHRAMHSTGAESWAWFPAKVTGQTLRLEKASLQWQEAHGLFRFSLNSTVVVREDYFSFRFKQLPASSENREDSNFSTERSLLSLRPVKHNRKKIFSVQRFFTLFTQGLERSILIV